MGHGAVFSGPQSINQNESNIRLVQYNVKSVNGPTNSARLQLCTEVGRYVTLGWKVGHSMKKVENHWSNPSGKTICNLSSYNLSETKKFVLAYGLEQWFPTRGPWMGSRGSASALQI